ncbi:hypothetical protein RJ640_018309 [Escallonia rubra]|uniref:Bet v I/Major latex protein domain-containing protein n=1 Tax=Escallonia rubra TaxID=112253 RepID=A0AA88RZ69_9ASTE|nr:hypothetical protein RJ640_018309 [Escallonia rubra]
MPLTMHEALMIVMFEACKTCKNGKAKVAKDVIDKVDEKNKIVIFRVIEGDILELYKSFVLTLHVDTKGANNLVTWTFEYEKRSEDVEDPNTLMDFVINVTKDIETHHLNGGVCGFANAQQDVVPGSRSAIGAVTVCLLWAGATLGELAAQMATTGLVRRTRRQCSSADCNGRRVGDGSTVGRNLCLDGMVARRTVSMA